MPNTFRKTLQFYLIDCKTALGKIIDIFIIFLNLFICLILVVETYPVSEATRQLLWQLEVVIVIFFIIEYVARLYASQNRLRQLGDVYSIIDLIAILPTLSVIFLPLIGITLDIGFIRFIRAFRTFRIFRFLRFAADGDFFFGSITPQLLKVTRLFLTILMIFFISSGLFFYVESDLNPNVKNFGDAFYFTVVALTTVGFGDIIPLSDAGKWVTVLMILSGIVLIPWEISQIVKEWMRMATKKEAVCPKCGLRYHDEDASHCKSCGQIIYQEYDGG
ncbi:MAG: ion transporter [Desulfobacterales bacterium]|uniref:Ion transporter n=1 Tax=Candidatus Desulfatibia vada TaxID=2841696 RepID=A0A8J6TU71_9BACT|nr:ion transporter [Candidatus Desulfatibia vada]MBL6972230.1 ion transporter [Desulfobacterales bacterium]